MPSNIIDRAYNNQASSDLISVSEEIQLLNSIITDDTSDIIVKAESRAKKEILTVVHKHLIEYIKSSDDFLLTLLNPNKF